MSRFKTLKLKTLKLKRLNLKTLNLKRLTLKTLTSKISGFSIGHFKLFRLKRFWCLLWVPLSMLLTTVAHRYPAATERLFSRGVYRLLAESYGRVFGYLPFSVAQGLLLLLPLLVVVYLMYTIMRTVRKPGIHCKRWDAAVRFTANLACGVGVGWLLFTLCCGLNYARESFALSGGLAVRPSSVAELTALCEELVLHVNESASHVTRDAADRMIIADGDYYALARDARQAYAAVAAAYPILGGYTPRPKPVLYSRLMSWVDIVGIYIPFTMEANVNVDVWDYNIPSAMAHELAHFKGFMREDEANFIAYLACRASEEPAFVYSGDMLALVYATNQLRRVDGSAYQRIMGDLDERVWADFKAANTYWQQFAGPVAEFSSAVNDAYLKTNRQTDGIQSYGRMVDLLLADYRQRPAQGVID